MKTAFACLLAIPLFASTALALPPIPKYLEAEFQDKPEYKAFLPLIAGGKCSACHIPGADKKAKGHALNDFGQAMHKHLDDKGFLAADKAKDMAGALKLLNEAWGKAIEEKNADGTKYIDLIKEGKNPGKNPEKKEKD
jgi:hypothetical protein